MRSISIGHKVAVSLWLLASACSSEMPESFLVYDHDASNAYSLMERTIDGFTHPYEGRGEAARLRGGGEFSVSLLSEEPQTEAEAVELLKASGDSLPRLDFSVDADGLAIPWDFDTAMMFSVYHHLKSATDYFASLGVPATTVGTLTVYYNTDLNVGLLPFSLLADNAAYVVTLDAFWIPPRRVLDEVPLHANRGVMVHEFSHAMFNRLVQANRRAPAAFLDNWDTRDSNALASLNEGVADTFGVFATGQPNFIEPSINESFGLDRDVRDVRHYTSTLHTALLDDTGYDPYPLGSVAASTLYALTTETGLSSEDVGLAMVDALEAIGETEGLPASPYASIYAQFFDAVWSALPIASQSDACTLFRERLDAIAGELQCS